METRTHNIDTIALHAGHTPDAETLSRAVPIYQTTSYMFRDTEHAANLFALKELGNIYTRLMNPTTDVLEKRLAALHGATGAVAAASGQAAIFYAISCITSAGQNMVSSSRLYGGTHTLFSSTLKRFGIEVRYVDTGTPEDYRKAIDQDTRLVYTESIGNPSANIEDFAAVAEVAHDSGIPLVVDNTVSPPPVFNPFDHGADLVVYSLTKMIGGHGTSIGGAIVENGTFDWSLGNRFPEISQPDESYHGVNFWDAFGNHDRAVVRGNSFVMKVRTGLLRDIGAALSPFNAFLFIQGIETLPLRARAHTANARRVAEYLAGNERVSWVGYPGLDTHPDHARAAKYFPLGPGAVFGFGVKGGYEAGRVFINNVKLASHLANILDARTLVIHPASTTHQQLSEDEQRAAGLTADFVRISVGLEDADDIIADLDQALAAAAGVAK